MRKTVIDIGTNTILMLIAEYNRESKSTNTLLDRQWIPRLGKSVDASKNILPQSFTKATGIIKECITLSEQYRSKSIKATATSFLRDAVNKDEFIKKIKEETDIDIEILSGVDEAKYSYIGAVFCLDVNDFVIQDSLVQITQIDIGGGSTEISMCNLPIDCFNDPVKLNNIEIKSDSLDIGAVRIKEKFFKNHPTEPNELTDAEDYINKQFNLISFNVSNSYLIGTAGTITTLGAVKLNLKTFDKSRVENIFLSAGELDRILNTLSALSHSEIKSLGNYMHGREDIITAGAIILKCFMDKFGFEKIKIRTSGLRYGIFLRENINAI